MGQEAFCKVTENLYLVKISCFAVFTVSDMTTEEYACLLLCTYVCMSNQLLFTQSQFYLTVLLNN